MSSMILSSRATRFCLLRGVFVLPDVHTYHCRNIDMCDMSATFETASQPIATDGVAWSVCLSVVSPALQKMAELI